MSFDQDAFSETLNNVTRQLLESRVAAGYWEGELASSALSTATAVFALSMFARESSHNRDRLQRIIHDGANWLVAAQNPDGGWGDTVRSISNISTTVLCWAALNAAGQWVNGSMGQWGNSIAAAEAWLRRAAGSLEPEALACAIAARYGKDQTFSAPILTTCALADRLGEGRDAWRQVPQLPFELAACPHQWFKWLRLPVVSYALPALIAVGQVKHHYCPTCNPVSRLLRDVTRRRTLRVLQEIQPQSGGFLEAVPLTSFVVMSLAAIGQVAHPVALSGVDFLARSARADGSFPIDTNLATWVTTLSVNALALRSDFATLMSLEERRRICDWLLGQQYQHEHPYTHAAPGGWAWTDLPGGVPDADDTAGALLALRNLGFMDEEVLSAATAGIRWLLDLQNRDGGIPTFCRGWGNLPFDRSAPDLTAHAIHAWVVWQRHLPPDLAVRVQRAVKRALRYLARQQREDGAWVPLWFGNQFAPQEENPTYGTARVLVALNALNGQWSMVNGQWSMVNGQWSMVNVVERAVRWLLAAQNDDGGWGGDRGVASSIEETALAVNALSAWSMVNGQWSMVNGQWSMVNGQWSMVNGQWSMSPNPDVDKAVFRGVAWLIENTDRGQRLEPSPIGFYFAKLWYHEKLYPLIFTVAALASAQKIVGTSVSRAGSGTVRRPNLQIFS